MEYAIRITRSYQDISGVIADWATVSHNLICYEHKADSEIKATHVHILIMGCTLGQEGLKKRALKYLPLKGNQDWSFRPDEYFNDAQRYITYMSKGQLVPVFTKEFDPMEIERLRALWVAPKSPAEHCVQKSEKQESPAKDTLSDLYQTYCDDILENVATMGLHLTIKDFRGPSIAFWRKRNGGLLPQTSTYKRFLTSVYLEYRDLKRLPMCENTLNDIELKYA